MTGVAGTTEEQEWRERQRIRSGGNDRGSGVAGMREDQEWRE